MKKIIQSVFSLILSSILLLANNVLHAAGFYLSEVGTPGGLGTAGTANTTNTVSADAAWSNPAGMTGLKKDEKMSGLVLLLPKVEFNSSVAEAGGSDGGNAGVAAGIPSFFMVTKLSDKARFGFSIVAPLGGGADYGDDFVGRYGTTQVSLQGVSLSPSFAYQINDKLSLGAGVSMIYTLFDQDIAVKQGSFPDGKIKIDKIDDWGGQFFAGLTYQINERALLGMVYRSELDTNLEGDVKFKNMLYTPAVDSIKVDWNNPQIVEIGLRYKLSNQYILFTNVDWEDWSEFSDNRIAFDGGRFDSVVKSDRNFKDTWHLGFGIVKMLGEQNLLSFGVSYDSSPVDDEDRTIDLPVDEQFKLSTSYAWKGDKKLDFALGATLIYDGKGKIDQTSQGVRFKGEFDNNYFLFVAGTVRYTF